MTPRPALVERGRGQTCIMYILGVGSGLGLDIMDSPVIDSTSCSYSAIFWQTLTIPASLTARF